MNMMIEVCVRCGGDGMVENDSTGRESICGRCHGAGLVNQRPLPEKFMKVKVPSPGSLYTFGGGKVYGVMCWPDGRLQIETPDGLKDVPKGADVWEFIKEQHPLDFPDSPIIVERQ